MKKWFYGLNIAITPLVAAAFIFAAPGLTLAADDKTPAEPAKVEKSGKKPTAAETKGMNKTDKTPKVKTAGNGADKVKTKVDTKSKADEKALKKGGKTDAVK